jgi:hypothetical protein
LAIGALAIRTLVVNRGRIEHLNIEELEVGRAHVRELVVEQERRPSTSQWETGFHRKVGGTMNSEARGQPVRAKLRTWLLIAAASVTIFSFFHHVDHVVWGNHSGWPFEEELTPLTFSLLIYALLLPGLYLTWRGRLMAGYWLFAAAVLLALVTSVHFVGEEREASIRDIYAVYDSPV